MLFTKILLLCMEVVLVCTVCVCVFSCIKIAACFLLVNFVRSLELDLPSSVFSSDSFRDKRA